MAKRYALPTFQMRQYAAVVGAVRLACQIRPTSDITVTPVSPANASQSIAYQPGTVSGHEQEIVIMFVDLRGSTRLGEERLPYDVVFILN